MLADLRPDAAGKSDPRRIIHAWRLFRGNRASVLRWPEYLGDGARRRPGRRRARWSFRTAGADAVEDQSARAGAGNAGHVVHHLPPLPGVVWRPSDTPTHPIYASLAHPRLLLLFSRP